MFFGGTSSIFLLSASASGKSLDSIPGTAKTSIKEKEKRVFPRMTEVVLERTFDLELARKLLFEKNIDVELSDSQYAYHINSPGINKGTGFTKIMEKLSISSDDVIAIGDSATDIPLFKVAKTSIALGNASDQVKSEANMVVSAKAGDGVLEALDKLAPKLSEI